MSLPAVELAFATKPALLRAAISFAIRGDIEPTPMLERPWARRAAEAASVEEFLGIVGRVLVEGERRSAGLVLAAFEAANQDESMSALADRLRTQRAETAGWFVDGLVARGALRDDIAREHAVDTIWLLMDPHGFHVLTRFRGWSAERFGRGSSTASAGFFSCRSADVNPSGGHDERPTKQPRARPRGARPRGERAPPPPRRNTRPRVELRIGDSIVIDPPRISVMLIVPDGAAAVSWYANALGARPLWDLGGVAGMHIDGAPFFLHEAVAGREREQKSARGRPDDLPGRGVRRHTRGADRARGSGRSHGRRAAHRPRRPVGNAPAGRVHRSVRASVVGRGPLAAAAVAGMTDPAPACRARGAR